MLSVKTWQNSGKTVASTFLAIFSILELWFERADFAKSIFNIISHYQTYFYVF
nr:MAG TPA: hypothetical protein [Caudoviricetes sp.]